LQPAVEIGLPGRIDGYAAETVRRHQERQAGGRAKSKMVATGDAEQAGWDIDIPGFIAQRT
jgi:hypothetical protein